MSPSTDVQAHRRPRRRLAVRGHRRRQTRPARPRGHRLHPQPGHRSADGGLAQRRATGARGDRAQRGRRDSRGPHRRSRRMDPRRNAIHARDDRRLGTLRQGRSHAALHHGPHHRGADRRGARVRVVGHSGPVRPVRAERRRAAAGVPERDRRRAPIAGVASRLSAVGMPARGHPPGAVPGQSLAGRSHGAGARGAHRGRRRECQPR